MRKTLLFLAALLPVLADLPAPLDLPDFMGPKIAVQNSILAKVNGNTISVMDVKKKMDLFFHQNYPSLRNSAQARCQFYEKSWRAMLMEMIDQELILADAVEKEIKVTEAEVRETIENRFGPNVLSTLDKIDLSYEDAMKMIKNEIIVQRMSWWFVQSKAIQSVSPQNIREAYSKHLKKNPPFQELKYRIISFRSDNLRELAEKVHHFLIEKNAPPEHFSEELKAFDPSIQVSSEYATTSLDISEFHKDALFSIEPGHYSKPTFQKSRTNGQETARIFYLIEKTDHPAPAFQDLSSSLRDELIGQAVTQYSRNYIEKLRKYYGFDAESLKKTLPEDLHPFSLQ